MLLRFELRTIVPGFYNASLDREVFSEEQMTFVVTENCRRCRFTDCVAVCPVDCFHGDDEMLYIDPDECIDCGACVPECPVEAIFDESQLPDEQRDWLQINAEKAPKLPVINETGAAYPGADERKKQLGF